MTENALPVQVVETDHNLEKTASRASEELARHRWHWTLDESNPARVSIQAYARAVGRGKTTVQAQVNGYNEWINDPGGRAEINLNEATERARMGVEKAAVTEAVAQARGTSFGQTRKTRPDEVRRVREIARERAEEHGTTVEEEAPKVAQWIAKAEKADHARTEERRQKIGLRFVEMEGYLATMKRAGTAALNLAHQVPWGAEEQELLSHTVSNVKALLALIDTALGGAADIDWDAELNKLTDVKP
jgi:hypothetical protein